VLEVFIWLGTITFAASGTLVAVQKRFDIIGALVLASVSAVGGGAIRDIVVGSLPPASLRNETLAWLVALTSLSTFYLHRFIKAEGKLLYSLDTLGLALFAALGAERGIAFELGMWGTVFTGAVSGVGGGVLRDVLSGQIPGIFYRSGDFYATAAAAGALTVFVLHGFSPNLAVVAGIFVTLMMRVGSRLLGMTLPVPRQ
jgi:uncharacterized membrane protein YeiH